MTLDVLPLESELAARLAAGHTRTRATELAIDTTVERALGSETVVLVEGISDAIAVEVIASRCGRSFAAEEVTVVPMGGATNVGRFVSLFKRHGVKIAGLYDIGARDHVRRTLEAEGYGRALESLGFFACVVDLEDELLRSIGPAEAERVIERHGHTSSFRKMRQEPHYRDRSKAEQIHRFVGRSRYRYARLLAEAVDMGGVPAPVQNLLDYIGNG